MNVYSETSTKIVKMNLVLKKTFLPGVWLIVAKENVKIVPSETADQNSKHWVAFYKNSLNELDCRRIWLPGSIVSFSFVPLLKNLFSSETSGYN